MIAKTVFFIEDSAPAIELTNIVLAAFQKIVNDGAKPSPGCSSHRKPRVAVMDVLPGRHRLYTDDIVVVLARHATAIGAQTSLSATKKPL